MIRAAFFDIDGTLVSMRDHITVPESTWEALRQLRLNGIKCYIATGRAYEEISANLTDGVEGFDGFDGYVCCSGQLCCNKEGDIYHQESLDEDDVRIARRLSHQMGFPLLYQLSRSCFINRPSPISEEFAKVANVIIPVRDDSDVDVDDVIQLNAFADDEVEAALKEALHHSRTLRWVDFSCDIVPRNGGKEKGIEATMERIGSSLEEAVAFGDAPNDLGMLRCVGTSVVMGNAWPEYVRKYGDLVTDSVEDDGIYRACVTLGLIDDTLHLGGIREAQ